VTHENVSQVTVCLMVCIVGFVEFSTWIIPPTAQAIPAFARKYQVNCHVCHTRWPRLNPFGERFLENGYQMPGTEDGGIVGKMQLGDMTLDDVSHYIGFLFAGTAFRHTEFKKAVAGSGDQTEIATPPLFRLLTAGTIAKNVSFFMSAQTLFEKESAFELEKAFMVFDNLGGQDIAHIRIGRHDPSSYFSFPTHRPQFGPIGPKLAPPLGVAFTAPTIARIPILPSAFASKFYGLFDRSGTAIAPFEPSLFNSEVEVGIDVHGRPFGDWFLYQVGVMNGGNERAGDSNNSKDWYAHVRLDYAEADYFSANLSGFAYFGNHNAKVASGADVSRSRYGLGARLRYKILEVYGAYTIDRVRDLPVAVKPNFDSTASGVTLEANVLATDKLLLGLRFDHLDAGGLHAVRKSNTLLGFQAKYYLRSNLQFFVRDDVNIRKAEGGSSAARNFRNNFLSGMLVAF